MDELLDQFLIEGRELTQRASDDLLALERTPGDPVRIDSAFRAIHTLKGSSGLFDLAPMSMAMHAAEDLIGALRDGRLAPGRAPIDALLACVGAAEVWIDSVARTGGLPADAASQAGHLAAALQAPLGTAPAAGDPRVAAPWLPALLARHGALVAASHAAGQSLIALHYVPARDCFYLGDDPLALMRAVPGLAALHIEAQAQALDSFDPFACTLIIEALSTAPADAVAASLRLVADQVSLAAVADPAPPAPGADAAPDPARRLLRVDAARVDAMVDIVGELIVAKNGLAHLVAQAAATAPALAKALSASQSDIERLVAAMHRAVMGARMVPLSQTFRRFPRLVRDLADKLGRPVRLDIGGGEIEADKTIVDGLYEPLLHILRNAVDHGIEPANTRSAAGKPAAGCIAVTVTRDRDQIVITVTDDGAGIDPANLRRVAAASGVASAAAIEALDDAAALDLLFVPGFSTAATVTAISGRGVGMDAVRMAVQALGGQAAITSRIGAGSTVRLTLPQAVAITTVVIVRLGQERFAIPIDGVAETTRINRADIMAVQGGAAFVLRDRTIPLLQLADLLQVPAASAARPPAAKILVVSIGDQLTGVEVDGFENRSDVLLRPLTGLLAGRPGLLGAALLGDGRVVMVLDMPGLVG